MIAFDFNACKDGNDVKPFRYEVVSFVPSANVFEPKKLDPGLNLMDCRYSQLGAALHWQAASAFLLRLHLFARSCGRPCL